MHAKKLLAVFFSLTGLSIALCAQVETAPAYDTLNGNWRLSQEPGSNTLPSTFSLGVERNTIYGEGHVFVPCPHAVSDDVFVRGQIAADGSFDLTNPDNAHRVSVSIQGKFSDKDSSEWSGSYTFVASQGPGTAVGECPATSGSFVATRFPLLTGVYSGTLQTSFRGEAVADVVLELEQRPETVTVIDLHPGETPPIPAFSPFDHIIPVRAKITFSNSLRIPAQTWVTVDLPDAKSRMQGNMFSLEFPRDKDGVFLNVVGSFDPKSDQNRLQVTVNYLPPGEEGIPHFTRATGQLTRKAE